MTEAGDLWAFGRHKGICGCATQESSFTHCSIEIARTSPVIGRE